ncbi:MAG TPA: GNAT family N-acetyltransferase [Longimicrobiales bacterium]
MSGAATLRGAAVVVRPVSGRAEQDRFIRLPWRIYAADPVWVPPLLHDVKTVLDRRRHPFHRHAEVEYFLAWRGAEVVGRIAAIVNHRHNEFHGEKTGFFGFFECIDDAAVADALLGTAEDWLRERGMVRVLGPMSFSTNEEAGLGALVDGFDHPPVVMTAHTPRYYPALFEGAGYVKAKDLLAYWLDDPRPPERLVQGVERLRKAEGIRIRTLNMKDFAGEVARIKEIYNSAWERNWGFVPMTDEEFDHLARQLKPVVNPRLCGIAEVAGEPVGFALALPDFNRALKHVNGRLLPFGIFKLLWHQRKIDTARVLTLGLKPGYRRKGIDAMLYLHIFREGVAAGYYRAECSWILEDNWDMRRGLERMGARVYKTYRIYEKVL